jgi:heme exporter protein B
MELIQAARTWWWLVHKDLLREIRAPRTWPATLLVALALAMVIQLPLELPAAEKPAFLGAMFWLAAFFAGTLSLDRSFAGEQEEGCWQGLLLYPVSPATVYLSKVAGNFLALGVLNGVLLLAFTLLSGISLAAQPGLFLATAVLANLGFAAVGTLASALTTGLAQRSGVLVLILLPLVLPVILAAVGGTQSILEDDFGAWWRWLQLLACFAAVFLTLGTLLFEFIMED